MGTVDAQENEYGIYHQGWSEDYKKILTVTNAHLSRYQPDGNINITRGENFHDVIAPLFAKPKGRGVEYVLRRKWTKY